METTLSYCDEPGELRDGIFFELCVLLDQAIVFDSADLNGNSSWMVSRHPDESNLVYGEVLGSAQELRQCSLDSEHVTGTHITPTCVDLFGGPEIGAFVPDEFLMHAVISEFFLHQLSDSPLKGWESSTLRIGENQSRVRDPILHLMSFRGEECLWERKLRIPKSNMCQFCRRGSLVCEECGFIMSPCSHCGKDTVVEEDEHGGPADLRIKKMPFPDASPILNAKAWDGSDFILGRGRLGFMTKRAVQWMLDVGASPFVAMPCRANVTALSVDELKRIEKALEL